MRTSDCSSSSSSYKYLPRTYPTKLEIRARIRLIRKIYAFGELKEAAHLAHHMYEYGDKLIRSVISPLLWKTCNIKHLVRNSTLCRPHSGIRRIPARSTPSKAAGQGSRQLSYMYAAIFPVRVPLDWTQRQLVRPRARVLVLPAKARAVTRLAVVNY